MNESKIKETNDIVIREQFSKENINQSINDKIDLEEGLLTRKDIGIFNIKKGNEISFFRFSKKVSDSDIAKSIINIILGFCLYQKKKLVFHSSAIEVDNQAILFSGLSGSGKSSLSISFHDCNFITEDVSCIDFSDERPAVIPGLPLVKLSNAIANRFIKDAEKIPLDFDRLGRSYYHVKNHINENIPISKLYFLEWGNTFKISEIEPKETLTRLFLSTFSSVPIGSCKTSSKIMMQNLSIFLQNVKVYLLCRDKDMSFRDNDKIMRHILQNR